MAMCSGKLQTFGSCYVLLFYPKQYLTGGDSLVLRNGDFSYDAVEGGSQRCNHLHGLNTYKRCIEPNLTTDIAQNFKHGGRHWRGD